MGSVMQALKQNYHAAKGQMTGVAVSRARRLKSLAEISLGSLVSGKGPRPAKPTSVHVRAIDGKPMTYFSDGSIRHSTGRAITKAARKRIKQARQQQLRKERS